MVVGAGIVGLAHAVAGVETRVSGTLVVARTSVEEQGLQELTRGNGVDERGLLAGSAAAELLGIDADHAPIAAALLPHERGEVRFSTTVHAVESGIVETNRGTIKSDHVFVAAGHLVGRLLPDIAEQGGVRECALQMARVQAPAGMPLGPAVLTATSMLRYGAFAGPALEPLRAQLRSAEPELLEIDANVMFTHQSDGTLLVGDSHVTHDAAPPFLDERWTELLLRE